MQYLTGQPANATWTANAELENTQVLSIDGLGAAQEVSFHDGKVYLYGDVWNETPRVICPTQSLTGEPHRPTARIRILTLLPPSELEGYRQLSNGLGVFITSSPTDNLTIGKIKLFEPQESPPVKSSE